MIIAVNSEPSETGEPRETSEARDSCNYSDGIDESDPDLTCCSTVPFGLSGKDAGGSSVATSSQASKLS